MTGRSQPDDGPLQPYGLRAPHVVSHEDAVRQILGVAVLSRDLFPRGSRPALEANELQILLALHVEPGQAASELAARLLLARTTVSHALQELQHRALVEETVDEDDRRVRRQYLTDAGNRHAREVSAELIGRLRAGSTPDIDSR